MCALEGFSPYGDRTDLNRMLLAVSRLEMFEMLRGPYVSKRAIKDLDSQLAILQRG